MKTDQPKSSLVADAMNVVRGMLMGGADVIPGVSGGTVALILGIYERLVTAVSRFDLTLVGHARSGRLREAADHIDLRFLISLGAGIALGILSLGAAMNGLLTNVSTRPPTLAAFFGIILASSVLVARMIPKDSGSQAPLLVLLAVGGAISAFWLTGLPHVHATLTPVYVFICGAIGICAMILPGISGAYLLLVLGAYLPLTGILKALPRGDVTGGDLVTVVIFGSGCAVGLLTFSKVLRWLLARHQAQTMAVLCGLMIGALRRVWPFQRDLTPEVEDVGHKEFANIWPQALDGSTLLCVAMAVVGLVAVFLLDRLTRGSSRQPLHVRSQPDA